jgi:hypothetical protein
VSRKSKILPFFADIFELRMKITGPRQKNSKKFRSHVLNSLLVGRLAAGELRFPPVKDTHPGTLRVPLGSHTCNVRFTPKSGHWNSTP